MKSYLFCFLICITTLGSASAAVISRDWKASGDGLLTFDTINKREWLDLSQTLLQQFPGATLEDQYQSVAGELGSGGLFEGFTVAKREDVIALAQSAGIDTSTSDFDTNNVPTFNLIHLLGSTFSARQGHISSNGLIDGLSNPSFIHRVEAIVDYSLPHPFSVGNAGLLIGSGRDLLSPSNTGAYLFRNVIPEPGTAILVIGELVCLSIVWRLGEKGSGVFD